MFIRKLILHNYNRFFLSNIKTLEYTPNNTIQMIASRNLAGKSSLLKQLNPLPIDVKKDFKEGGYKYIEIEHLGNEYKIRSDTKNSFIFNNTELNPGGTKKVQLDLIKEHFGLTQNILDIIYNTNSLTVMSPSERKHWFTEMSNVDYVYPIKVYNLLKQRHRDILGYIKLTQDNIIKTELNILNKDTLDKLKNDKKYIEEYLNHIISLYDHSVKDVEDITTIKSEYNNLSSVLKEYLNKVNKDVNIKDIENIINNNTVLIEDYNKNIDKLKKQIDELDKIKDLDSLDILKDKLNKLKSKKENIEKNIYIALTNNRYNDIYNEFAMLHPEIMTFYNNLIDYEDTRHLSKEDINNLVNEHNDLARKIKGLVANQTIASKELDHMRKHKTEENLITCSKCSHTWYLHYDPNTEKELEKTISTLDKEIEELNKVYVVQEAKIDKIKHLVDIVSDFKTLLRSKPILLPIWHYIFNKHNIKSCNISELLSDINKLLIDLEYWKDLDLINKEIDLIENNMTNTKLLDNISKPMSLLDTLVCNLEETTKLKNNLTKEIELLKEDLILKNKIKDIYYKLLGYEKQARLYFINKKKSIRNKYLGELVDYIKTELYNLDKTIKENEDIIKKVEEYKNIVDLYKKKEKALNTACKILSPDEGLIAKSINGFITVIVDEMNSIINSIWTYDLQILPCEVSDTSDLNYKFKVKINNDHIVEDVSKLSSSGKEIVDLAFRLVFTKYIGLIDMPLFLDEFGNTFDKAHRSSAYAVVDKIMSGCFKQIFIVCHYESIYGSLRNIDFNVLDNNNIDLDPSIETNQVMKITRE